MAKWVLVCIVYLLSFGLAQNLPVEFHSDPAYKELFNNCKPMSIVIERMTADGLQAGMTEMMIENMVETELRYRGIYDPLSSSDSGNWDYLYIRVDVYENFYSTATWYIRPVYQETVRTYLLAPTWWIGTLGVFGGNTDYLMSIIRRDIREFIDEYMRINLPYC